MHHSLIPPGLRYTDQVARSGSIQKAARELHVAASAINRHILAMEDELGVPLFERVSRGMRLTPAGDALIAMVRRWKQEEARMVSEVQRLQGMRQGHVSLVAMDSHANSVLPSLVHELGAQHPTLSLSVELAAPDAAEKLLMNGSADLAAIFNLAPRRELLVLWKQELPLGCVVAKNHALAHKQNISFQEAVTYPMALQSKAITIRRYLEAQYSWLFQNSRHMTETNSLQLVKQLALGGQHVIFTSELDVAAELAAGLLVFIPIRDQGAEPQSISVAVDATRSLNPLVKLVADQLIVILERKLAAARTMGT